MLKSGRRIIKEKRNSLNDKILFSASGVKSSDVPELRRIYGSNSITKSKSKGFFSRFISNFNDPIIKILLGALVLNIIFSFRHANWPETIGVAIAVLIATLVSTISEHSTCRAAEKLSRADKDTCFVRRDGRTVEILISEVVPGDIVFLSPGMMIPADGIMTSGNVKSSQSAITGEGKDVSKYSPASFNDPRPLIDNDKKMDTDDPHFVFKGSTVTSGNGEFLVLRTGNRTFYGEVAMGLSEEAPESPLKKKLSVLASDISFIGYIAAIMVAVSYLFNVFFIDSGMDIGTAIGKIRDIPFLLHELISALTLAVSVLVVAVPEGLPMMITVVLSSNMKKMLRHGVLVKKMVGIETAGGMSILFTDKTGTLTEGKMTLKSVITIEGCYHSRTALSSKKELYRALYDASRYIPIDGMNNSADKAFAEFFSITEYSPDVVHRIPFTSEQRFASATVLKNGVENTYLRGAPEVVFAKCNRYMTDSGDILLIDNSIRSEIEIKWKTVAKKGARVIASAIDEGGTGEFIFCGLLVLEDRLRSDAAKAVKEARTAGIKTVMITGDNKMTASAIAEECGILSGDEIVITGEEMASMTDDDLSKILPKLSVIARALPSDKMRIVRLAGALGYVTGMTGDGINDAPSLKAADVGFAMGSGTDVTKEAGDIVITNNSFSSIIRAVLYGRTIFKSIRKFIFFQLTMNLCATAVSFLGPFVGVESPVTIIQMLWVNIIMDTLGALAFAWEPPKKEYMTLPPTPREVKILTGSMIGKILLNGLYMVSLSMYFLLSDHFKEMFGRYGDIYFLTAFFAYFIFCGIFLSFNARTPKLLFFADIGKNKPFILIMSAVAVIQLMLVYFGGEVFRCTPLLPGDMIKLALIAATVLPAGAVIKLLGYNRNTDM